MKSLLLASVGIIVLLLSAAPQATAQQRVTITPTVLEGDGENCPAEEVTQMVLDQIDAEVNEILENSTCGGPGWRLVTLLDLSDTDQTCLGDWQLNEDANARACQRQDFGSQASCDSATLRTFNREYQRVCGRVIAYQRGPTSAFRQYNSDPSNDLNIIDAWYVDGVSITHGEIGNRTHIWTFAGAYTETPLDSQSQTSVCQCTNPNNDATIEMPPFVEENYFCETGNNINSSVSNDLYVDDPLWDGTGCQISTCCQQNSPPYFLRRLPELTRNDIEVRICNHQANADTLIRFLEIYIQ